MGCGDSFMGCGDSFMGCSASFMGCGASFMGCGGSSFLLSHMGVCHAAYSDYILMVKSPNFFSLFFFYFQGICIKITVKENANN